MATHQSTTLALARACSIAILTLVGYTPAGDARAPSAYPERPVRLIVPFPPGGANDIAARLIAHRLNERWGRPVVIDNRAGAGGNIGTEMGARAAPDGYTLTVASGSTFASNVGLHSSLPFDPVRDFAPIVLFVTAPYVLAVNNAVAAASVQELLQLAKKSPGSLSARGARRISSPSCSRAWRAWRSCTCPIREGAR